MQKQDQNVASTDLRPRILKLIALIFLATAICSGTILYIAYDMAFEGQRQRLQDLVSSTRRIMESELQQEMREHGDTAVGIAEATLHAREILDNSQSDRRGLAESGEFTLGQRAGNDIEFLIQRRDGGGKAPDSVPWSSSLAEPMRRALQGQRGTMVGRDYLGHQVLAAYEPIPVVSWGLVAKIRLDEIKRPFIKTSVVAVGIGGVSALLSVLLLIRTGTPLLHRMVESEGRIRASFNNPRIGIAIFAIDGKIVESNERFGELFSGPGTRPLQPQIKAYTDDLGRPEQALTRELKPSISVLELDGDRDAGQYLQVTLQPIYKSGQNSVEQLLVLVEDVSEQVRAERRTQNERKTKELILESIGEGIYGLDLDGAVTFVNSSAARSLGYEVDELIGRNAHEIMHHTRPDGSPYPCDACPTFDTIHAGTSLRVDDEVFWRKNGQPFPVEYVATPITEGDRVVGAVVAFRDISARRESEEKLSYLAYHDTLTGLPNRSVLDQKVADVLAQTDAAESPGLAMMFIDVDRMKRINDSLGHQEGDAILKLIAERLAGCVPSGGTLARYSGDEFAILVPATRDETEPMALADRIFNQFALPFLVNENAINLTVSLGLVIGGEHYRSAADLLRDADIAVFESKKKGGGCLTRFTPDMGTTAYARLEKETSVRQALDEDRIDVYYQPIVDLESRRVVAMEALVRMYDRDGQMVGPDEFIPVAEETDLIVPLGNTILSKACSQVRNWRDSGLCSDDFQVSVNLSPRQLMRKDFAAKVRDILQDHGISGSALKFEVTESLAISNPWLAEQILRELRALGASVCMDDFGTGYSSLSYVHQLPIDTLKIDRAFIVAGAKETNRWAIVESIISMCRALKLKVIAEGIEDEATADRLVSIGCEYGQGFHFARPLNAADATDYLASLSQHDVSHRVAN
ncbi:MAG: EAL domain-containing protein [Gammaproteobacteria bacterium]|nr:EAL domain-containing protein [Gammaproteobacteria bacterium]